MNIEDPSHEDVNQEDDTTAIEASETEKKDSGSDNGTPEAQADDANEEQASDDEEGAPEEKAPPRKINKVSKRIQQINAQKNAAEARAAALERQVEALRQSQDAVTTDEDMSDDDYVAAIARRAARETALYSTEQSAAQAKQELAGLKQQEIEERINTFVEAENDFMGKFPDYVQVIEPLKQIPPDNVIFDLVAGSDNGPQVAYYLGKNPQEAFQVANMSQIEAARHIGRIEARLSAPAAKLQSTAPKPILKVTGKSSVVQKSPENMSMAEYEKWRLGG